VIAVISALTELMSRDYSCTSLILISPDLIDVSDFTLC